MNGKHLLLGAASFLAVVGSDVACAAPNDLATYAGSLGCPSGCRGNLFRPTEWGALPDGVSNPFTVISMNMEAEAVAKNLRDISWTGNGFFDPSQYAFDCGTGLYVDQANSVRVCRTATAPIVGADFVGKLQAAGLTYRFVHPIKDHGNGRAYVVWNSPVSPRYAGANFPSRSGYARIEGVAWQSQFHSNIDGRFPLGDAAGSFVDAQSQSVRETTLRIEIPGWLATIGTSTAVYYATLVTDDWLAGTSTPPAPPVALNPAPEPPAPPSSVPVNVGGTGTGAGGGSSTPGGWQATSGDFDWVAYCSQAKAADGTPRSQAWIQGCLIGH